MPMRTKLIKAHVGHARSLAQQAASWHQGLLLRATLARLWLIGPFVPRSGSLRQLGFLSQDALHQLQITLKSLE
jgi:hypothetical protein